MSPGQGGQSARDLEDLARINANRYVFIAEEGGLWLTGLASALLTGLAILWEAISRASRTFSSNGAMP